PASRREARPAVALRNDVEVLDLEQVARLRAFHVHRAGERVRDRALELLEVLRRRLRADLQVVRVAPLDRDVLARLDLDDSRDIRMPAVVALARLLAQALLAVDGDALRHRV